MRNVPLSSVDHLDRTVLAIGTDYASGTLLDTHAHHRAQFLYGMSGLMEVDTDDGTWVVPPHNGVWIPALKPHRVRLWGVSTRSLYIEPAAAPRRGETCEVLLVSQLLHQLLLAAADISADYANQGRDACLMELMLHELRLAPSLPFYAPMPIEPRLAALARAFLQAPSVRIAPEVWAASLNLSVRQFSRVFRQQTGLNFAQWRQQACLLAALARLSAGTPVTTVALDVGYASSSAFAHRFRQAFGRPPSAYMRR